MLDGDRKSVISAALSGAELLAVINYLASVSTGGMAHPLGHVIHWFLRFRTSRFGLPLNLNGRDLFLRSEGWNMFKGLGVIHKPLGSRLWFIWKRGGLSALLWLFKPRVRFRSPPLQNSSTAQRTQGFPSRACTGNPHRLLFVYGFLSSAQSFTTGYAPSTRLWFACI